MKGLWSEHFPTAEKPAAPNHQREPQKETLSPCKMKSGLWSEHFPTPERPAAPNRQGEPRRETISPCKMKSGLRSEHFPAAEKQASPPPLARYQSCLICPTCNASTCRLFTSTTTKNPGRQFYKCPAHDHKFFKWADEVKPDELIDVPNCGGCTAGVCRVRKETSGPNAGRILFMCRVKEGEGSCGYRVWQDELDMSEMGRVDERMNSSQSRMVNCNDTNCAKEMSESGRADERMNSSQSSTVNCNDTNCANTDLVVESKQSDERADTVSPIINTSELCQCSRVTSGTMSLLKCQEDKVNESSRRPHKRSRYGDVKASGSSVSAHFLAVSLTVNSVSIEHCWMAEAVRQNLSTQLHGWWGRLAFHPMPCLLTFASKPFTCCISSPVVSTFVVQDILVDTIDSTTKNRRGIESYSMPQFELEQSHAALDSTCMVQEKVLVNFFDSTTLHRNLLEAESYTKPLFIPDQCDNAEIPGITPLRVALDVPSCSDHFRKMEPHNFMSKSISNAFCQAAERLQNDLLTLLETMDVKDHKAMSQAAEDTFAALDRLLFDHHDFKNRVKELIHCSSLLAEIEQSLPTNDSYQKLVEHCSSERMRLDEIKCVHAKAIEAVTNNKKRLKVLQEEISSTMDWLFQVEAEVSCCEVEMENMERELEQISRNKEVLEGKFLIASKELEESQRLLEQKEAERNAAKAAFDRARALLRG